jgi:hypothetical protein
MPEDNIELGALSVANMTGQSRTYTWTEKGSPGFGEPKNANILKINLKAALKPFAIVPPSPAGDHHVITSYGGHGKGSFFNFWDHWQVSQGASDGKLATSAEKPSHSSLCHIGKHGAKYWEYYAKGDKWLTKVMLHGMTGKDVTDLVPLAKSWVNAPKLKLDSTSYNNAGYDQAQRAYQLVKTGKGEPQALDFHILSDKEHPAANPAFVIKNWGSGDAVLKLDGKDVQRGKTFRFGHRHTLEGSDLIVWLKAESTKPMVVSIVPVKVR